MFVRLSALVLGLGLLTFAPSALGGNEPVAPKKNLAKTNPAATEAGASATGTSDLNPRYQYRLLATNKTSTMQKELNQAAEEGFRYAGVMGGETAFGGSESVVIMTKDPANEARARFEYKLLATNKTSTMQKELQQAGDAGFEYKGQTAFSTTFGGREVVIILERDPALKPQRWEYKLLATNKTSTMQKELTEAGQAGYEFVGVTVAETAFGGREVVSILRRTSKD